MCSHAQDPTGKAELQEVLYLINAGAVGHYYYVSGRGPPPTK